MSRLNRKRKASGQREADRERGKKIGLERSAAKTLLTLHLQTGKSHEEHAAARALLDLTLEPVPNSVEPDHDDEATREFEERTDEFPEPMATDHVNRNTQTDEKPLRECGTQVSEALLITLYIFLLFVQFIYHNIITNNYSSVLNVRVQLLLNQPVGTN